MPDCPICQSTIAEGADSCAKCGTQLKPQSRLPESETSILMRDGFAFYAGRFEDAIVMKEALSGSGFKVIVSTEDFTKLGISLHDTHGYKIVVPRADAEEAFNLLREQCPRALFSDLESGLGVDITEVLNWPLHMDFRAGLLPGLTLQEFLVKVLGDQVAEGLLRDREAKAEGSAAIAKTLEEAFAEKEVQHDSLQERIRNASAAAFDALFDGLLRACREKRDDIVWPVAKVLKPFRGESLSRRAQDFGPAVRAEDPGVRRLAVLALAILSDRKTVHYLVEALRDRDETVRYEAIDGLFGIVGEDFGYVSDGSQVDREAATRRWEEWLTRQ